MNNEKDLHEMFEKIPTEDEALVLFFMEVGLRITDFMELKHENFDKEYLELVKDQIIEFKKIFHFKSNQL